MPHLISTTLFLLSPVDADLRPHFNHVNDIPPSSSPQHLFSMYVPWPVSRQSEPIIPETDENRLSARVTGRPRPPRRLQSQRKVTVASSWWEISHIWRLGRAFWYKHRAAVWQFYWFRMHDGSKTPTPSKNSTIWFRRKTSPQHQYGYMWEPSQYGAHYNFGYFSPMKLLGRSKRVRDRLGVSKWIISLGLCGFATILKALGWASISDYVQ